MRTSPTCWLACTIPLCALSAACGGSGVELTVDGPAGIDRLAVTATVGDTAHVRTFAATSSPLHETILALLAPGSTVTFDVRGLGSGGEVASGSTPAIAVPAHAIVERTLDLDASGIGGPLLDGGVDLAGSGALELDLGSPPATDLTLPPPNPMFVQKADQLQAAASSVSLPYPAAQKSGDLNLVVILDTFAFGTVATVSDSSGNAYTRAIGPTRSGDWEQHIFYAPNIHAAASNSVTVTFGGSGTNFFVTIVEYSGIGARDDAAASSGTNASPTVGALTTTVPSELVFAAGSRTDGSAGTFAAGNGFTARDNFQQNLVEDRVAATAGSYQATASLSAAGGWILQAVTFK